MAISLGGSHQRLEDCLAVLLHLRCRDAVNGLRFGLRRRALIGLPVAVGFIGQHAQGRQATIGQRLATIFSRTLVAQQQAQGTGCQGTAARTGKHAAQPPGAKQVSQATFATSGGAALGAGFFLQHLLAGFKQLVEQTHKHPLVTGSGGARKPASRRAYRKEQGDQSRRSDS